MEYVPGEMVVQVDGEELLRASVTLPDEVYVGASGSCGYNDHRIANIAVTEGIGEVDPSLISIKDAAVSLGSDSFEYVGEALTPSVTVTLDGNELTAGDDYTVTYRNNARPGTATVVVRGVGVYTGRVTTTFSITRGFVMLELDEGCEVSLSENDEWYASFTAPEAGRYRFYSTGSSDTYGTLYADRSLEEDLCSDDDSGEECNFRMTRTLEAGETVYLVAHGYGHSAADFTAWVSIAPDANDISSEYYSGYFDSDGRINYTGEPVELPMPNIHFYDEEAGDESDLVEGTDFEFDHYEDEDGETLAEAPSDLGTYLAVYRGIGSYKGTHGIQFRIVDFGDLEAEGTQTHVGLEGVAYYDYDEDDKEIPVYLSKASAAEPVPTVIRWPSLPNGDEETLEQDVDYTVSYQNNDGVTPEGEYATVTITGIGRYHGTVTKRFKVVDSHDLRVFASKYLSLSVGQLLYSPGEDANFIYTGEAIKPVVSFPDAESDGMDVPVEGEDFEVEYRDEDGEVVDPVSEGWHIVALTAKDGSAFHGSANREFFVTDSLDIYEGVPQPGNLDEDGWTSYRRSYKSWDFDIADAATDLASLAWDFLFHGMQFEEGTHYTVRYTVYDDFVTYIFEGINNFAGTVRARVYHTSQTIREFVSLELDEGQEVSLSEGEEWYAIFTAPEAGRYRIYTTGDSDTYGTLYADESLDDWLCSDDDAGEGCNFRMTRTLKAGETVYLVAYDYYHRAADFTAWASLAPDANDISNGSYYGYFWSGSLVNSTGQPVELPTPYIYFYDEETGDSAELVEGADYEFDHYEDEGGEILDEAPSDRGTYRAVYRGIGSYKGMRGIQFRIADYGDLEAAGTETYVHLDGADYIEYDEDDEDDKTFVYLYKGDAVEPTPIVTRCPVYPDGEYGWLERDVDYTVSYQNNDSVTPEGEFATCTITGIGKYHGVVTQKFKIVDSHDLKALANEYMNLSVGPISYGPGEYANFLYTGEVVKPAISFPGAEADGLDAPVEGEDFEVEYRDEEWEVVDPVNEGWYRVSLIAKDGSAFHGTVAKSFDLVRSLSLNDGVPQPGNLNEDAWTSYRRSYKTWDFDIVDAAADLASIVWNFLFHGMQLEEGTDYTVHQSVYEDVVTYVFEGINNFAGTVRARVYHTESQVETESIEGATISNIDNQVFTGEAITPEPEVILDGKTLIKDADYTLTYQNNVNAGEATVTVTGAGNYMGTASRSFSIVAAPIASVTVSGIEDKVYSGNAITQDNIELKLGNYTLVANTDYEVAYANNTNEGAATVTISAKGQNFSGTREEYFQITKISIDDMDSVTYTGNAITPKPAVKNGSKTLVEGADFTYSYQNNVNAGTAAVIATVKAEPQDIVVRKEFTILPAAVTLVTGVQDATYTGEAITPAITVKANAIELAAEDYDVSYLDNVNVGTASVIVEGKGNFSGKKVETFRINAASIAQAAIAGIDDQAYTGKAITPALTVTLGTRQLIAGTDYTVAYANNKDLGTATVTITGVGNYAGTASTTFAIVKRSLDAAQISGISDQVFTGSAIEPSFSVTLDGRKLSSEAYDVQFANNVNVGEATITVTAKANGNYTGSTTSSFIIVPFDLADATIGAIADQTYTSKALKPELTVEANGKVLAAGTDYTATYASNTNVGPATVTINAQGSNYVGSAATSFSIVPASITSVACAGDTSDFEYTGNEIKPQLVVKAGELTLSEGTDYEVAYLNNVNAGGATATVAGKGNFAGTSSATFTIGAASSEGLFIDAIADQIYMGSAIEPQVTVKFNGAVLNQSTYKVTYTNNTNKGIATATIEPTSGNFTGTRDVMFNILPASITSVEGVSDATFTGSEITFDNLSIKTNGAMPSPADYTVTYQDNVHAGTATVTVAGKDNFVGTVRKTFRIAPKSISGFTVSVPASGSATGQYTEKADLSVFEPIPTVYVDASMQNVLDPANYDVSYKDNAAAGDATVLVTGKGDYTGTATGTFTIVKYAGSVASDGDNSVVWFVEDSGAMTIKPKSEGTANLQSASALNWSQAVADYTTEVTVKDVANCTDTSGMFSGLTNVTSVNVQNFDTSQVTNMSGMFAGCENLTADGIQGSINTTQVTNMNEMFAGCTLLDKNPLADADTSNVTSMQGMFRGCTSLQSLTFENSGVQVQGWLETIADIFVGVQSDGSGFSTANVTNMSQMFEGCTSLVDLDLSGFVTSQVTNMSQMFAGCTALKTLNISSFDTSSVTYMANMFDRCKLSEFSIGSEYISDANQVAEELPISCAANGKWWAQSGVDWMTNERIVALGAQAAQTYSRICGLGSANVRIASSDLDAASTNHYVFNGSAYTPRVDKVIIGASDIELTEGVDYTVGYERNTNAGTAYVVINGLGDYASQSKKAFAIDKKSIASASVSGLASQTYTGKAYTPKPTVKVGSVALALNTDYTLSYKDNTNAGTATVTVKGTGNYKDSKTATFTIAKAANTFTAKAAKGSLDITYNASTAVGTPGNVTTSKAIGSVGYTNASSDAAAKRFAVDKTSGKVTVPKGTQAGTYEVKVNVKAAGNANFSPKDVTISYKIVINKANNTIKVTASKQKVKLAKVKKKAVTVARPMSVSKAVGKVTYKNVSTNSKAKKFTVNKSTGKVTVAKGTKKGTYKIKIKVSAAGNANYKAATKSVTCSIVVK
ncbi:MAG: BspA family leucine-rich repeat surface protein [Coriobacteriales bacterium]|nr:BspA family leucine-rich repeat surface protein [Coriobacteriales bacterium]